jgi:hypothetical protein
MAADIDALSTLLAETGVAHGVYEETELKGVYDQEWFRWYAAYAVEHGIGALVGHDVTAEELATFLARSNADLERIDAGSREPWPAYTARRIAAEL